MNAMENKTAVEWLIERLRLDFKPDEFTKYVIPQAIEMERQQIKNAYDAGAYDIYDLFEQYYSETYKKPNT